MQRCCSSGVSGSVRPYRSFPRATDHSAEVALSLQLKEILMHHPWYTPAAISYRFLQLLQPTCGTASDIPNEERRLVQRRPIRTDDMTRTISRYHTVYAYLSVCCDAHHATCRQNPSRSVAS